MKITCLLVLVLLCAVFTFFLNFTVLQLTEDDDSSKKRSLKRFIKNRSGHKIAGLSCERYGGPPDEIASEMVYWRDIKTDEEFRSPFASVGPNPKYLTFEPDEGNWNNKRLSMETAVVMAVFMGRTLVLPPQQELVYSELFHFAALAKELPVDIITMEEFLNREALTGNLRDEDGKSKFPPDINRTSWDGDMRPTWKHPLWPYLREVTRRVRWEKDTCIAAFPDNKAGPGGEERLRNYFKKVQGESMPLSNMKDPLRYDSF